jgi:MGT family glycosyltransferase
MVSILLAAHPTAGHTNALRAIGRHLLGQGHAVAMTLAGVDLPWLGKLFPAMQAAVSLPQRLVQDGFRFLPLRPPLNALLYSAMLPHTRGLDETELAIKLFTAGIEAQSRQIAKYCEQVKAGVVVGDYLMPAAMLAAERIGCPYVALYHSALPFPIEGAPPFGLDLSAVDSEEERKAAEQRIREICAIFDRRVSHAARRLGLRGERRDLIVSPISRDLNLLATAPELEPGLRPLHDPVLMTGPCLPPPGGFSADDPALHIARDHRTRIYVSLGTVFNGKPQIFKTILRALSGSEFLVIVSAGASYSSLVGQVGDNIHLFRHVPQIPLLSQVDIVVTHGGNNTVQETLAAGKPMVVIPFGGDQIVNARRVETLGVGAKIAPESLTVENLINSVKRLNDSKVVERAKHLQVVLGRYGGGATASDAIVGIAKR